MRIYSRAGIAAPTNVHERERPMTMRNAVRETREVEAERYEMHPEIDPMSIINPTNLRAPAPRSGYVQRWIYDGSVNGDGMRDTGWVKKRLAGWEPRDPATISEYEQRVYQTVKNQSGESMIRMGPMVLCEQPIAAAIARRNAVREVTLRQRQSMHPSVAALKNGEAVKAGLARDVHVVSDESRVVKGRRAATMLE